MTTAAPAIAPVADFPRHKESTARYRPLCPRTPSTDSVQKLWAGDVWRPAVPTEGAIALRSAAASPRPSNGWPVVQRFDDGVPIRGERASAILHRPKSITQLCRRTPRTRCQWPLLEMPVSTTGGYFSAANAAARLAGSNGRLGSECRTWTVVALPKRSNSQDPTKSDQDPRSSFGSQNPYIPRITCDARTIRTPPIDHCLGVSLSGRG